MVLDPMRSHHCLLGALALIASLSGSASGQESTGPRVRLEGFAGAAPTAPNAAEAQATMPLTAWEAVRLAMQRNLDLRIQRLSVSLAREQIRQAEGEYDPLAGVGASYGYSKRYPNNYLEQTAYKGFVRDTLVTPNASVSGKLTPGTQYNFSLAEPYDDSDNPIRLFNKSYQGLFSLTVTQPLWRGFGFDVNLVSVRMAEKGERQAFAVVEAKILQVVLDVERKYWAAAYAADHVRVAAGNLALAEDLVARLERALPGGLATASDVRQAKAAVAARHADLARAQTDLATAQATLRQAVDPKQGTAIAMVPVERPSEEAPPPDKDRYLARALAQRPELRAQQLAIERLALQEVKAEDNTHPFLNLVGSIGYTGLAGSGLGPRVVLPLQGGLADNTTPLQAWSNVGANGPYNWSVGLQFQVPIGNRQAEASLAQARIQKEQEELRLEQMKGQIAIDVESAFGDVVAAWAQVLAAREGAMLSRQQAADTDRNFAAGGATIRQVLEAQQQLAITQDTENMSRTNYANNRARLEAVSTASFQKYQLLLEP